MNALPTTKLLASYWIPYVGIGKPEQRVTVPLTDIAKYVLANGQPQTNVVFLGFASFTGTPQNFAPPYISIPPAPSPRLQAISERIFPACSTSAAPWDTDMMLAASRH